MNEQQQNQEPEGSNGAQRPPLRARQPSIAPVVNRPQERAEPAVAPWEMHPNNYQPPAGQTQSVGAPLSSGAYAPYQTPVATENGDFAVAYPHGKSAHWEILGWIIAIGLIIGLAIYALVPASVPAPTSYTTYVSPDGRFSTYVPASWNTTSTPASNGDNNEIGGALFKNGPAKIDVTTDTVSDLKTAVLLGSGAALPDNFTKDPTDVLHDMEKGSVAVTFKNYNEQPAIDRSTGMGDALVSEFTGKGGLFGWGGPMHGYRLSISDGRTTLEAVFSCPEKSWTTLQPAFDHVIASISEASIAGAPSAPVGTTDFGPAGKPVAPTETPSSASPGDSGAANPAGAAGYGGAASDGVGDATQ